MSQNFDENRKLKVLLLSSVHLIQLTWTWRWVGTCPLATHVVLSGRQGAQGWLCRAVSPWIGNTGRWSAPSIDTRAVRPAGGSEWPVSMPPGQRASLMLKSVLVFLKWLKGQTPAALSHGFFHTCEHCTVSLSVLSGRQGLIAIIRTGAAHLIVIESVHRLQSDLWAHQPPSCPKWQTAADSCHWLSNCRGRNFKGP